MCVRSGLGLRSVSEGLSAQTSVRNEALYGTSTRGPAGAGVNRVPNNCLPGVNRLGTLSGYSIHKMLVHTTSLY